MTLSHQRKALALPWAYLSYALLRSNDEPEYGNFQVTVRELGRRIRKTFNNRAEALAFVDELKHLGVHDFEIRKQ